MLSLTQRVRWGDMTAAQFERMSGFLDAERLGVAREVLQRPPLLRTAARGPELGLSVNDVGQEPVDLDRADDLLRPARDVWAA